MADDLSGVKLGKLQAKHLRGLPTFGHYAAQVPTAPASVINSDKLRHLGQMANDQLGDCTCAAVGHAIQLWTSRTQPAEVVLSDNDIVDFYARTCGYVRGDPLSDNGGIASDVLAAWYKTPLDGHGLAGFANIRPGNRADIRAGIWLFGVVYIGVQLPLAAQSGEWDLMPDKSLSGNYAPGSWGGHAIPIVDYDQDGATCITWGALKKMSWAWLDAYCDEAYALLSRDWLDQAGHSPANFDFAALQADMLAIRQ